MKCDELKPINITDECGSYRVYNKSDVDAAIDELKTAHHKERHEYIKMVAELKEERRWRKFPDEKPKWGVEVIVVDDASKQYIVRFSYDMKWISWGNMNTCESKYVKYWMPLPSAPEDADK